MHILLLSLVLLFAGHTFGQVTGQVAYVNTLVIGGAIPSEPPEPPPSGGGCTNLVLEYTSFTDGFAWGDSVDTNIAFHIRPTTTGTICASDIHVGVNTGYSDAQLVLALFGDADGQPGEKLTDWAGPFTITTASSTNSFTNLTWSVTANTDYWVVLGLVNPTGNFRCTMGAGTATGWNIMKRGATWEVHYGRTDKRAQSWFYSE